MEDRLELQGPSPITVEIFLWKDIGLVLLKPFNTRLGSSMSHSRFLISEIRRRYRIRADLSR